MRERTHLEQSLKEYHGIERELDDALTLAELGEAEGDEASIDEAQSQLEALRARAAKKQLDLTIDHTKERRQFGRSLAEFELVQEKIGWMVSYLFGLESMAYLTCGLVDRGVEDYSLESAICCSSGSVRVSSG